MNTGRSEEVRGSDRREKEKASPISKTLLRHLDFSGILALLVGVGRTVVVADWHIPQAYEIGRCLYYDPAKGDGCPNRMTHDTTESGNLDTGHHMMGQTALRQEMEVRAQAVSKP